MTDRYDHTCSDPECCSYKQKTYARCCGCHKTREQMMLEHIAEIEQELENTESELEKCRIRELL